MKRVNEQSTEAVKKLKAIADEAGLTLLELSLGWVSSQPGITAPIIGARSGEQLRSTVAACRTVISDEVKAKIDEVVPPGTHIVEYYNANFGPNARPYA